MIPRKNKLCKCGCGRMGMIWAKGMLKDCYYKSDLSKKTTIKRTPINRDYKPTGEGALFDSIISTRRPISFISGLNIKDIDGIVNHNNCHHVLNKKDYGKFRLYDRNIILITKYEHHLIHNGTEEQREKYVKDVMSEYGVVVHWEKLEELKQILINEYKN